jgi:Domain of unknown function (DUF4440)
MTLEATAQLEEALRQAERRRLRSLVVPDLAAAEGLHADDFELITPGGATMSKREYLDGIASGELNYSVFEPISELRVRLYDRAAILRYRVRIEISFGGNLDAGNFWHTDAYELRDGIWQAVWSQATRIRD